MKLFSKANATVNCATENDFDLFTYRLVLCTGSWRWVRCWQNKWETVSFTMLVVLLQQKAVQPSVMTRRINSQYSLNCLVICSWTTEFSDAELYLHVTLPTVCKSVIVLEVRPLVLPIITSLKGEAIPLQAWTGPKDSTMLRLQDFKIIDTWRW